MLVLPSLKWVMGPLSLSLAIGAANGFALSLLLAFSARKRVANLFLAGLIALLALRFVPYVLGYAGLYDAHRWLTFVPLDFSFAFGPLLWIYVSVLTTGKLPSRWRLHLAPAAIQLGYWLVCFSLPLDVKWNWYSGPHLGLIAPLGAAAGLVSAAVYLTWSWQIAQRYQEWLDGAFANREEARLQTLRGLLLAFGAALAVAAGFAITSWFVVRLDYFARFPLMVVFALLTYVLGLMGWRNTSVVYPLQSPDPVPESPLAESAREQYPSPEATSAYRIQADAWRARLVSAGWWRDATLDLNGLATRLATTPRTLSRVLGEGLGQNFREFIGRVRIEAAACMLEDPGDARPVLEIAFDAGFNSKASFNRAFQLYRGTTPSEHRRNASIERLNTRQNAPMAGIEAIGDTS